MADTVASEVIECATRVAQELGYGHSESVYHQAVLVELRLRGIPYESEKVLPIIYRGFGVGYVRDLVLRVNPYATIVPVTVLNSAGLGSTYTILRGIQFVHDYTPAALASALMPGW
jgi:hypothetical protein